MYVVIGLLCSCLGVRAEKKTGSCGTNLTWTLDTETMALTISGTGTMKEFENLSPWDEYCESNSTFPKSLTIEDGVTGISRYAFQYCQEVSNLYIPKSLTNISQGAFARSDFQSIIVAEDNPVYDSRENCNAIIHTTTNTLHIGSTSTIIPSSVTAIGSQSFMACGNLVSLDIPQTVTSMGDNVFPDCWNLSSIVIPEGVTKIGSMMFYNCTALKSATIPEGVTSIAESAFANCSSLASITIPKSVTNLGNSIFEGCIKLSEIWMLPTTPPSFSKSTVFVPSNTKIIVPAASYDAYCNAPYWSGMKSQIVANPSERVITIEAQDAQSALQEALGESDLLSITGLTISGTINSYDFEFLRTKMTKLAHLDLSQASVVYNEHRHYETFNTYDNQFPAYAFYNCSNLVSISLPEGVDRISHSAFMGCSNLTSIIIPDNLQYIEPFAFNGCSNLSSIDIPNDVSVISESAFEGCGKLTEIVLPGNITFIDKNLFKGCSGLTSILIPSAVTSIRSGAFSGCIELKEITLNNSLTTVEWNVFQNCTSLTSIAIPSSVTSLNWSAFAGCSNLTRIDISDLSKWIAIKFDGLATSYYSLYLNDNLLTDLVIPSGITTIGDNTFACCNSITSVSLPEGITSIGEFAFGAMLGLKAVTIPSTVTNIGKEAFYCCDNLKVINFLSATPPAIFGIQIAPYTTEFVVPASSYDAYCSAPNWSSLKERIMKNDTPKRTVYLQAASSKSALQEMIGEENLQYITHLTITGTVNSYDFQVIRKKMPSLTHLDMGKANMTGSTYISYTFEFCTNLTSISLPEGVTSIGSYAFNGCTSLASISLPEGVTSIGSYAFGDCSALVELHLLGTTPPALTSTYFVPTNPTIFIVTAKAYDAYCAAPYWADIKDRITTDALRTQSVELTAAKDKSDLQVQIGDDKLRFVTDLTISGTINSYDFMILRNKMPLLRHLDLSQANIVANSYEHYTGYHTEDNIFPAYGLYNCNLITLSFPANIKSIEIHGLSSNDYLREISIHEGVTSIGSSAFYGCSSLTSVNLPEGVTSIGSNAFYGCSGLSSISLPESVTSIGNSAFSNCTSLSSISLPESLTSIGLSAFSDCSSLTSVKLSPNLKTIGSSAFNDCSKLTEIHIPASVRRIGDDAFHNCSNMEDVYVYIVEPTDIGQNTFAKSGNNFIGTLHAPKVSYWDYYYNTQWSQFLEFAEFDGKYDNFYLEGDKVLDNNTGSIEGEEGKNPDAEMGENSGIIVEDDVNQNLGDVDIEHDGENGGSIIVDGTGNVDFENLNFRISVKGGRWYFFCFPFDVRAEDIRCENGAEWVFRYYDGEERAQNGKGGWKNVTSDGEGNMLKAARGYIFQCSKNDVLVLTAKNGKIKQENKYNELVEHVTENMHDASWNFVGNPYLSYYEVTSEDYSAPITVWDGSKYIAIRPGDDDYQLAPFEAFFVQKPEGVDQVSYNSENQMTYTQATEAAAQARQARAQQAITLNRLLVNITLTDGKETDRARVVFNENAEAEYETACDAAKFGTEGVPQIYTMDATDVKYAINERPMAQGNVSMGYSVPKQGTYTLAATRMDIAVYLMDKLTGTVHDLTKGGYEFSSESGTFDKRFILIVKGDATGIDGVLDVDADAPIYNVKGQQVKDMNHSDIYIQNNHKMVKK